MKRRYRVEVTRDNTGWITVTVPAIPEIKAEAHTREQALQFVARSVESHLKSLATAGRRVPDSDIDAVVVEV